MKKIPTIYARDESRRYVDTNQITPGTEWVFEADSPAVPTRKYDGTCVLFDGTAWWARREVKPGKRFPEGFREVDHDRVTGKVFGWEPIQNTGYAKPFEEALYFDGFEYKPGTYELCGPKIQGDPEHYEQHRLIRHADAEIIESYEGLPILHLIEIARLYGWEGIVWHHPDGRMAKLKVRDIAPAAHYSITEEADA